MLKQFISLLSNFMNVMQLTFELSSAFVLFSKPRLSKWRSSVSNWWARVSSASSKELLWDIFLDLSLFLRSSWEFWGIYKNNIIIKELPCLNEPRQQSEFIKTVKFHIIYPYYIDLTWNWMLFIPFVISVHLFDLEGDWPRLKCWKRIIV